MTTTAAPTSADQWTELLELIDAVRGVERICNQYDLCVSAEHIRHHLRDLKTSAELLKELDTVMKALGLWERMGSGAGPLGAASGCALFQVLLDEAIRPLRLRLALEQFGDPPAEVAAAAEAACRMLWQLRRNSVRTIDLVNQLRSINRETPAPLQHTEPFGCDADPEVWDVFAADTVPHEPSAAAEPPPWQPPTDPPRRRCRYSR